MVRWIKICGMTTPEAVDAALAAGADAIGFVFAVSRRRITPQRAAQLAAVARGRLQCVAVMRHPQQQALDDVLEAFQPDVLQSDAEDFAALHLPATLQTLPVLRGMPRATTDRQKLPARVLFEGPVSGQGRPADWALARELARRTQLVLAGGLNENNIATAIAMVGPYGVDVSSGVESATGIKDPAAIGRFVAAARSAAVARERSST